MIKKLYYYLKSLIERKPEHKDPIQAVFSIKGKQYYQFKDISKIKCQRALTANDFYNELTMRATRDFLLLHCKAVDKVLTDHSKIDLGMLFKLNQQLQERLDMIYETEIIYKIASVVFFTKEENIYEYDDLLGREKVDLFKSEGTGFFFDKLFKILIGSTDISDSDLRTYMTVGEAITKEHLKTISTILSNKNVMSA